MALIKCEECGHEVSDKASMCPNCGCPIQTGDNPSVNETNIESQPEKKGNGIKWALLAVLLCLICGGGYYAYTKLFKGGSDKDAIVELTPEFIKSIEKYDILCIFSEGFAAVNKDNKWGYINTKGQEVIPTKLDAYCVGRFSEGLAFVVNEKGKKDFSIIDKKGNIKFQGKEYVYNGKTPKCEDMPYFIDGKIYIPTMNNKYQVYDAKGTKLEVVDSKIGDSVYRQHVGVKYKVFIDYLRISENLDVGITKCGLQDSIGNVLISAKYDDIGNNEWFDTEVDDEMQYIACVSNGVVLVVLDELNEDYYTTFDGKKVSHYGYADLKGKDTFSEQLKYRCKVAEQKANIKMIEEEQNTIQEIEKANMQSEWLQGRWIGRDANSGYPIEVIISGNNMIQKINGQECYNGPYEYNGDMLIYNNANDFWPVDRENKVLTFGGLPMRKENGGSSAYSSSDSYSDRGSSNDNSYRFSTAYDVIGYLAGKTFHDVDGGGSLQIRENGVFVNGRCMTGAPKVISYSSYNATVSANIIPQGNITFNVDSENGTIRDSFGNRYR